MDAPRTNIRNHKLQKFTKYFVFERNYIDDNITGRVKISCLKTTRAISEPNAGNLGQDTSSSRDPRARGRAQNNRVQEKEQ